MSETPPAEPTSRVRDGGRLKAYAAVAGVALAIGIIGGLVGGLLVRQSPSTRASLDATMCPAARVANTVLPSVVTIGVTAASGSSNGSGVIVDRSGYILTNDHVISPGANGGTLTVLFSSGQQAEATLVGRATALDLAVIKVSQDDSLPYVTLGDSGRLVVGQPVVTLGAPLGLASTVTSGIVSALSREIRLPADQDSTALLTGAIQTDASINPGNSGGALVDCRGELIGINTAIATVPNESGVAGGGNVGIGFAIPVDLAVAVSDQIIKTGTFTAPFVGLLTAPISASTAEAFDVAGGLYVTSVVPGGPADKAGLKVGDVILSVAGRAATTPEALFEAVLPRQVGDEVTVQIGRNGDRESATLTLAAQPTS
ncbi:MAG: putative serine protease PepD [Nocardioidaceae bacterium]|nr:putative serine protease PepD [Nocardioidaceae bacterium]